MTEQVLGYHRPHGTLPTGLVLRWGLSCRWRGIKLYKSDQVMSLQSVLLLSIGLLLRGEICD